MVWGCFSWSGVGPIHLISETKTIEKPTHPKRVTVWCGFWSRVIIGPLFFENEQGEGITVNGDRYGAVLKALRATQPKLHSMFCALFLKIALSVVKLLSFGHLGAAI